MCATLVLPVPQNIGSISSKPALQAIVCQVDAPPLYQHTNYCLHYSQQFQLRL